MVPHLRRRELILAARAAGLLSSESGGPSPRPGSAEFGNAVSERFIAALRQQKLPLLDDKQLAAARENVRAFASHHPVPSERQRKAIIAAIDGCVPFYFGGTPSPTGEPSGAR